MGNSTKREFLGFAGAIVGGLASGTVAVAVWILAKSYWLPSTGNYIADILYRLLLLLALVLPGYILGAALGARAAVRLFLRTADVRGFPVLNPRNPGK